MKKLIFGVCCSVGLMILQGCSDSDDGNGDWSGPSSIYSSAKPSDAAFGSNASGDIVIVWQEVESQVRIDQALTDAHNPAIPYNETDPIPATRDMDPSQDVFEAYDSSNAEHRAEAKTTDYAAHDSHSHANVYSRTNILSRVYDVNSGEWQSINTLQTGFWQLSGSGNYPSENATATDITITDVVNGALNTAVSTAANGTGDAIAAWVQVEESTVTAGDAGEVYEINVARYNGSNQTWSAIEKIIRTDNEQIIQRDLNVALQDDGNANLFWLGRNATSDLSTMLYSISYDAGTATWSNSSPRSDDSAANQSAQLLMTNNDSGVLLWLQRNANGKSTYVEQAAEGDLCITTPTICNAEQGNLYAQQFDATGWLASPVLVSDGLGGVTTFSSGANGSGGIWVSWLQNNLEVTQLTDTSGLNPFIYPVTVDEDKKLWVSQLNTATDTWSAPVALQALSEMGDHQNADVSDIAVDTSGNAVAVWSETFSFPPGDEENSKWNNIFRNQIWMSSYDAGSATWSSAQKVADDDRFSHNTPQVMAVSSGKFTIVWQRWNTGHTVNSGSKIMSRDFSLSNSQLSTVQQVGNISEQISNMHLVKGADNRLTVIWQGETDLYQSSKK